MADGGKRREAVMPSIIINGTIVLALAVALAYGNGVFG
jgi:hypothetical protein